MGEVGKLLIRQTRQIDELPLRLWVVRHESVQGTLDRRSGGRIRDALGGRVEWVALVGIRRVRHAIGRDMGEDDLATHGHGMLDASREYCPRDVRHDRDDDRTAPHRASGRTFVCHGCTAAGLGLVFDHLGLLLRHDRLLDVAAHYRHDAHYRPRDDLVTGRHSRVPRTADSRAGTRLTDPSKSSGWSTRRATP